ncbi:hypothetical protein B0I21_11412 [Sphingobacterium paludis]|jgi:hypothetical protein|uniref:DUF5018 domain-containing protein n=2 Tax=Sphingobacterium paludis TaxID=1476465 RepID=A0A4R7CSS5_9SPHI|nr:hypothetical protein B0I21_11412 [Sphingobacterium paludis]
MLTTAISIPSKKILFCICVSITCLIVSCKTEYPDFPYNEMESFSIQDAAGNPLHASIVGNQIVVYWPPLVAQPETVTPYITVAERASVKPTSGTAISLASKEPITYTVTAQDGTEKIYTFVFHYNQPILIANITDQQYVTGDIEYAYAFFRISGQNILTDSLQTQGYLVDKEGKETKLDIASIKSTFITFSRTKATDPAPGLYRIKLISGKYTVFTDEFEVVRL